MLDKGEEAWEGAEEDWTEGVALELGKPEGPLEDEDSTFNVWEDGLVVAVEVVALLFTAGAGTIASRRSVVGTRWLLVMSIL